MKKSLVLMAMAGVALAGCVNDVADVKQKEQSKAIVGFDKPVAYGKTDSRVFHTGEIGNHKYSEEEGATTYSYPREETFHLYAMWTNADEKFSPDATSIVAAAFNDKDVMFQSFVDGWAPMTEDNKYYYWRDNKALTYAAISPADMKNFREYNSPQDNNDGNNSLKDGAPSGYNEKVEYGYNLNENDGTVGFYISDFETPSDPAFHYEVLYSPLVVNKVARDMNHDASQYSGLPVQFKRALSEVRFSIHTDIENEDVRLHKIKMWGVKMGPADFNENIQIDEIDWDAYAYQAEPSWEFAQEGVKVLLEGGTEEGDEDEFVIYQKGSASTDLGAQFIGTPKLVLDQKSTTDLLNRVFFIPQDCDDVMIEVTYQIGANEPNTKKVSLNDRATKKADGTTEYTVSKWLQGYRYTYRLYLSEAGAKQDKIIFSPSSEAWTEISGIVVDLSDTTND